MDSHGSFEKKKPIPRNTHARKKKSLKLADYNSDFFFFNLCVCEVQLLIHFLRVTTGDAGEGLTDSLATATNACSEMPNFKWKKGPLRSHVPKKCPWTRPLAGVTQKKLWMSSQMLRLRRLAITSLLVLPSLPWPSLTLTLHFLSLENFLLNHAAGLGGTS